MTEVFSNSSFNAVSSTFLVNNFNKPLGPVSSSPGLGLSHHRRRGGLLRRQLPPVTVDLLPWTPNARCHH
jgi:hypothetical protein